MCLVQLVKLNHFHNDIHKAWLPYGNHAFLLIDNGYRVTRVVKVARVANDIRAIQLELITAHFANMRGCPMATSHI